MMSNDGHFWQPVIIFNKEIKVRFHKENLAVPIYSPIIFPEPAQATEYLGKFVKDLVKNNDLPKESINGDNTIMSTGCVSKINPVIFALISSTLCKYSDSRKL
ncbi:MAG: hypothetical protein II630_03380, partial [Bacteroidales bacterium]|nr:hypothetical protein [Bacteroidales bacterium]